MEILKSNVGWKTVQDLRLNIIYINKEGVKSGKLYKNSPILVEFYT
jgi:hypothetical protein